MDLESYRVIWLTISLPWPHARYGTVRQGALPERLNYAATHGAVGKKIIGTDAEIVLSSSGSQNLVS